MAKKTQKPKKVVKKTKENKNTKEITYLRRLIELTLRNVDGKSESLDKIFTNQADEMKKRIVLLKNE